MPGNEISEEYKEIIGLVKKNNETIKSIISQKDEEIKGLRKALDSSESGRQIAESMVAQIKEEVNIELQKAYKNGYNAALLNTNPTGGTTISQENDKKLVLNNSN